MSFAAAILAASMSFGLSSTVTWCDDGTVDQYGTRHAQCQTNGTRHTFPRVTVDPRRTMFDVWCGPMNYHGPNRVDVEAMLETGCHEN